MTILMIIATGKGARSATEEYTDTAESFAEPAQSAAGLSTDR